MCAALSAPAAHARRRLRDHGLPTDTLIVDEELYLQAVKTLHELEGEEGRFEMLSAVSRYARESYLAARFASDMSDEPGSDWELTGAERRAIENYIAGIYLPGHHNL